MPTQNISATIEKTLLSKLDLLAGETERNRSWLIGKAIESYLDELEDLKIAKRRLKEPRLTTTQLKALLRKTK
jgi:predicted DNA-binding protein